MTRKPTADRPLLGQTVLVVEDSRFACEAMRLLCLRSGARIRRADSLKSAARHLSTYRPSVVIVDMGLPDGSGCELIKQLAQSTPRVSALLGTSGDDMMADVAMAAGADGFLAKPITSLAAFQEAVLALIPADQRPKGLRRVSDEEIIPDRLALKDDLAHIAEVLDETSDETTLDYVAQFLSGLARSADDSPLEKAAIDLAETRRKGDPTGGNVAYLSGLVQDRLTDHAAV
jgi:CheY-like chemotaxis protein